MGINPLVGAVLVREGNVIAEGWHEGYGKSHAELSLLQKFDQKISTNDTLYVNVEPCCHTDKKTPPCTSAILERGIRHVVYGMQDPNPQVAGKGIALLREHGINVIGPVQRVPCERLNRGFISRMQSGRPWITLHNARTRDERISHDDGSTLKITSPVQDAWAHEYLRATHDAILVGAGTVIADDPQLTVRYMNTKSDQRNPLRIVLDPNMTSPKDARIFDEESASGTLLVTSESGAAHSLVAELQARGVRIETVPTDTNGHFVWDALWELLITPNGEFHGTSSVLVEGGPRIWKSFRDAKCIDEEVTLVGD